MIIKQREIPIHIIKLDALNERLSNNHEKKGLVTKQLSNRMTGYKGEQSLDYYLSFLPEADYHIFHGLRLFDGTHHFQIDTLLVCRNFILILEVKRMAGVLKFEPEFNQFTRTTEDHLIEPYSDPITQVEWQAFQLERWLRNKKVTALPIECLVVSTSNKAVLQTSPGDKTVQDKVIHKDVLPFRINKLEKYHHQPILELSELKYVSNLLLKSHSPLNPDILKNYGISKGELLTGVQCPECKYLPLTRDRGIWRCPKCNTHSKTAHIKALADYSLLISPNITNEQARHFLHLTSQSVTKRILRAACTGFEGDKKSRIYFIGSKK
ncbi:NERD domain-containing protein [Bacillus sp. AK031]